MESVLVVISHYNAWQTDQLVSLLDQMQSIPAGHAFDCLIVVNQAEQKTLELPERHSGVEVLYRENVGYNIGAWDHGWRQARAHDFYLFVQEECRILRPGWLTAFLQAASKPGVGIVGESVNWRNLTWNRTLAYSKPYPFPDNPVDGRDLSFAEGVMKTLDGLGIPPGPKSEHLQSLILFVSRKVLEAIDGFPIGKTYGQAITSEVAISKRVEAIGLQIRTVGIGNFRYILHPQWKYRQATIPRVVFSYFFWRAEPWIPVPVALLIRGTPSYLKKQMAKLTGTEPKVSVDAEAPKPNL